MDERKNDEVKINNKGHAGKLLASSLGTTVSFFAIPFLPAVGIPSFVYSATKLYKHLKGDYIDNSIFSVSTSRLFNEKNTATISQSLYNPMQIFNAMSADDKEFFLKTQALNMFVNMDKTNKQGEPITYKTTTHRYIIALLSQMQRNGYITGLEKKEKHEKALTTERVLIGNFKSLNKKRMMYDVSFQRTDKDITIDDASKMFGSLDGKIIEGLYVPTFDKTGKLTGIELNTRNSIASNISKAREKLSRKLLPAPKKEEKEIEDEKTDKQTEKEISFRESIAIQKSELAAEPHVQEAEKIVDKQNDER